jgi:isocitrate/isopropylmalate dehydrogenase
MLKHLGESDSAERIIKAMERSTLDGALTADLGGNYSTSEVASAVIKNF